jgi:hypothetical protein
MCFFCCGIEVHVSLIVRHERRRFGPGCKSFCAAACEALCHSSRG